MALSGQISGIYTAQQVVDKALRKIGVLGEGETSSGAQYADAQDELNLMLKSWTMFGPNLWARAETSFTLVSGTQTYTCSPRPRSVENVRFAIDGVEQRPLAEWSRNDWDRFPNKTATGTPDIYVIDRQRTATTITFWRIPNFSSGTWTVLYSYERVLEDVTEPAQDVDVPQEWFDLVILALGARLADDYRLETPTSDRIRQRAAAMLELAMLHDRRGEVRFELGACDG